MGPADQEITRRRRLGTVAHHPAKLPPTCTRQHHLNQLESGIVVQIATNLPPSRHHGLVNLLHHSRRYPYLQSPRRANFAATPAHPKRSYEEIRIGITGVSDQFRPAWNLTEHSTSIGTKATSVPV